MERISRLPRWMHRMWARTWGYFWRPCSECGRPYGGHEWRDIDGKSSTIWGAMSAAVWRSGGSAGVRYSLGGVRRGRGICPACTRAGKGTR